MHLSHCCHKNAFYVFFFLQRSGTPGFHFASDADRLGDVHMLDTFRYDDACVSDARAKWATESGGRYACSTARVSSMYGASVSLLFLGGMALSVHRGMLYAAAMTARTRRNICVAIASLRSGTFSNVATTLREQLLAASSLSTGPSTATIDVVLSAIRSAQEIHRSVLAVNRIPAASSSLSHTFPDVGSPRPLDDSVARSCATPSVDPTARLVGESTLVSGSTSAATTFDQIVAAAEQFWSSSESDLPAAESTQLDNDDDDNDDDDVDHGTVIVDDDDSGGDHHVDATPDVGENETWENASYDDFVNTALLPAASSFRMNETLLGDAMDEDSGGEFE